jgi:Xaa-Pro aminopeptidase
MVSLDTVRSVQRLAYDCVLDTRKKLQIGMTEKDVASIMENFFLERGHKVFFHRPFAWFGDRTNFTGFKKPSLSSPGLEFMPSDRRLEDGMPVTLDVAPSVKGLAVDIGYSFSFGENAPVEKARKDLLDFREIILKAAKERIPIKDLYARVEERINELNYQNCHSFYPLGVLGHKIGKLPLLGLPKISVMGFHPQAYLYLLKEMGMGAALLTHNESRPMGPGLWAVEPHIGRDGFGVKFEEILVVTKTDAYWLDEQLPHVTELE